MAGGHASRPGGPVTFSPATYVIYHVIVNMIYHVIIAGRLTACPVAAVCHCRGHLRGRRRRLRLQAASSGCSAIFGTGPDFLASGWARQAGSPVTGPAAARGRRVACRSRGGRHWSRPAAATMLRFAAMTTAPWVAAPGGGSRRLTAGEVRNSLCSVAAGCVRPHPDYEDLVAHRPQARARQGRRECEPGPAAPVLAAGASRAGPRYGGCMPARDRRGKAGPVSPPPGANRPAAGASLV